ncbi:ParA family protein [Curtobacterium poinsettiae]|uniref:ParA family protein n=1 Tax=Curtobacterium poinsettiae TaxID=159612 RepID=UPI001BDE5524|nr:ParA family protein [Curtobacterium flaccumfaciens]MBT1611894.1 ParA family protein [Curtobacterium flaccumfaciens pv. poinsettiae]
MRIVTVLNQKGGVGKSNVVMNLAAVASEHSRVLVVDADHLQRTATDWAEAADQADKPLPYDFDAVDDPTVLAGLRDFDEYDLILVDTPGSLAESEVPRLTAALDNSDFVILPIEPKFNSIRPLLTTLDRLVEPRRLAYRILLSRVERDEAGQKRRDETIALLDEIEQPHFQTVIRAYSAHSDAPTTGDVVTTYPRLRGAVSALDDFKSLALELTTLWANEGKK